MEQPPISLPLASVSLGRLKETLRRTRAWKRSSSSVVSQRQLPALLYINTVRLRDTYPSPCTLQPPSGSSVLSSSTVAPLLLLSSASFLSPPLPQIQLDVVLSSHPYLLAIKLKSHLLNHHLPLWSTFLGSDSWSTLKISSWLAPLGPLVWRHSLLYPGNPLHD